MTSKEFVRYFFIIWGLIFLLVATYVSYYYKHYPLPLTDHISLDAKLKFVKEHVVVDEVDTMVIGSSIGLNNILGHIMEERSKKIRHLVNFSVYGATTLQAEQLLALARTFPHLKRVIYSVQYSDTPHRWRFNHFDSDHLVRYMRHELSPIELIITIFKACRNLPFCVQRQIEYAPKHLQKNKFESLLFDRTGSVPLYIYGKDIIGHRWRLPHPGIMAADSFLAMGRMAKWAKENGLQFYVVHQPYRKGLYEKYRKVRDAMRYFDQKTEAAIGSYGGKLIKVQPLNLSDRYFSDRTHLNNQGSLLVSDFIAKRIDQLEKKEEKQ